MQEKWHQKYLTVKPGKAVIKLRKEGGGFWKSVIIPTSLYPLNGEYEVFFCEGRPFRGRKEQIFLFTAERVA